MSHCDSSPASNLTRQCISWVRFLRRSHDTYTRYYVVHMFFAMQAISFFFFKLNVLLKIVRVGSVMCDEIMRDNDEIMGRSCRSWVPFDSCTLSNKRVFVQFTLLSLQRPLQSNTGVNRQFVMVYSHWPGRLSVTRSTEHRAVVLQSKIVIVHSQMSEKLSVLIRN